MAGVLSPAASEAATRYSACDDLPVPRSKPVPHGSAKMTGLINYLDQHILNITRRYAKSFATEEWDDRPDAGYTTFEQVLADLDGLIDVVWVSATLSVRLSYLLALAGYFRGYMHSFTFDHKAFAMARKFDQAFATLLESDTDLISTTDKVRIRSLAEETRYEMVEIASRDGWAAEESSESEDDNDFYPAATPTPSSVTHLEQQSNTDSLGKVYEKTLVILGDNLTSLTQSSPEGRREASPRPYMDDVETFEL